MEDSGTLKVRIENQHARDPAAGNGKRLLIDNRHALLKTQRDALQLEGGHFRRDFKDTARPRDSRGRHGRTGGRGQC